MKKEATMPRSRVDQLIVQEMPEETLVYDLERHKAHCLNAAAAAVWRRCDGKTDVLEVARELHRENGLPENPDVVWTAIGQLRKAKLLDGPVDIPAAFLNTGRREALKRIGLVGGAAALLPVITSIVAPTAVSAVTCKASGFKGCTSSAQCCSGLCNTPGMVTGVCA